MTRVFEMKRVVRKGQKVVCEYGWRRHQLFPGDRYVIRRFKDPETGRWEEETVCELCCVFGPDHNPATVGLFAPDA